MAQLLPPPPINDQPGSFSWLEWYRQLRTFVTTSGSVPWYIIDFTGSDLTDLAIRNHNQLQSLQGGAANEYYHLTAAEYSGLSAPVHNDTTGKQGGTVGEYYHLTSTEYSALGDPPDHNDTTSKQGGTTNQYYHLTSTEYTALQAAEHNVLTDLQGGTTDEYYHLTAAEYAALIPDAPSDGNTYGRKDGAWVVIP